jgi:hypothetical protein
MKKMLLIATLGIILAISSLVAYLLISDTMLIQPPVLVKERPVLTYAIGSVQHRNHDRAKWENAIVGTTFSPGSEIRTGEQSLADIRFHRGTAIRITEKTLFRIKDQTINELKLHINSGSLFGKFERMHQNHTMELQTDTTVAAIRGTELGIEIAGTTDNTNAAPRPTTVYAMSGIIGVYNSNFYEDTVLISNQKKLTVFEDSPPSNPESMSEDEIEKLQSILNAIHEDEVLFISDRIHFATGSSSILPESHGELDKIAEILANRREKVLIEGIPTATARPMQITRFQSTGAVDQGIPRGKRNQDRQARHCRLR